MTEAGRGIAGGDTRLRSPLTRAGRRALRLTGCRVDFGHEDRQCSAEDVMAIDNVLASVAVKDL
jgi:hypothetical protein